MESSAEKCAPCSNVIMFTLSFMTCWRLSRYLFRAVIRSSCSEWSIDGNLVAGVDNLQIRQSSADIPQRYAVMRGWDGLTKVTKSHHATASSQLAVIDNDLVGDVAECDMPECLFTVRAPAYLGINQKGTWFERTILDAGDDDLTYLRDSERLCLENRWNHISSPGSTTGRLLSCLSPRRLRDPPRRWCCKALRWRRAPATGQGSVDRKEEKSLFWSVFNFFFKIKGQVTR